MITSSGKPKPVKATRKSSANSADAQKTSTKTSKVRKEEAEE